MEAELLEAKSAIEVARRILLISHRKPDGDTLGAVIALACGLESLGKETMLACRDDLPHRFRFLPRSEEFQKEFDQKTFDLMIICDAGSKTMTDFHKIYPDFLSNKPPILNIDHHPTNEFFGKYNLVDPSASSTTMIVFWLLKALNIEITSDIALSLLTGIYNDTGSFRHSNTTKETFAISAQLMKTGISVSSITTPMFKQCSIGQLRLWGKILETMHLNEQGVLSKIVTQEDLRACGAVSEETGGIIDLMATGQPSRFAMLITEEKNGFVKGSFRTNRDDVNVAQIAGEFGGGGHKKAAGFAIPGKLVSKTVWTIEPLEKELPS